MAPRFFVLVTVSLTLCLSVGLLSQTAKPPDNPDLIAADQLYKAGKFAEAAEKYQALLKADPKLAAAEAGLVEALLRQQKIDEASAEAEKALGAQPNSAALLAAMGDVQFRLAEMAEAETSYHKALQIDSREIRAYLGLARLWGAYSLYRHAYDALKLAYQIAPNDPEVQRLWFARLSRRERLAAIEAYLAGPHPDDPEQTEYLQHYLEFLKATVDKPAHACRLVSKVQQTDTKLQRMVRDPRHIVGFGLEVKLNDRTSRLLLDTGASGITIGRKGAEKAGLTRISDIRFRGIGDKGLQGGYLAVADHIRIGELEFADCVVTVIDRASVTDEDGLIGANVFGSYLIDIDFPAEKLRLSPLPKRPDETVAPTALNSEGESGSHPDDSARRSEGGNNRRCQQDGHCRLRGSSSQRPLHRSRDEKLDSCLPLWPCTPDPNRGQRLEADAVSDRHGRRDQPAFPRGRDAKSPRSGPIPIRT